MSSKKFTEMVDRKHGVVNADITTDRTGSVYYPAANFRKIIGVLVTGSVEAPGAFKQPQSDETESLATPEEGISGT